MSAEDSRSFLDMMENNLADVLPGRPDDADQQLPAKVGSLTDRLDAAWLPSARTPARTRPWR